MGDKSQYHSLSVGYNKFFIDKRYINLKPCGDGSYGFVASAYDVITGEKISITIEQSADILINVQAQLIWVQLFTT